MQRRHSKEEDLPSCPSFSIYSSGRTAEIAAKVSREAYSNDQFQFLTRDSAGEIFPVFDRDLLSGEGNGSSARVSLKELLNQELDQNRDFYTSSSWDIHDDDGEEKESVPQGTYCAWASKSAAKSPGGCKKSNSTGSSLRKPKKWWVRELLRRSRSDGKEWFAGMMGKKGEEKGKGAGKNGEKKKAKVVVAKKKKQEQKEGEKRRSYLPYRQDILGFPGNVNRTGFPRFV